MLPPLKQASEFGCSVRLFSLITQSVALLASVALACPQMGVYHTSVISPGVVNSVPGAQSNTDIPPLEDGKPIERALAGGEAHSYRLAIAAGQFCQVVVDQRGVDVVVAFYGLDGAKIVEVDSPTDTHGQEPISLMVDSSGTYRLEVRSPAKNAPTGRYEVKLEALRVATPEDRSRVGAQKEFTDAKSLRNQRTADSFRKAIDKYQEALVVWRTLNDKLMQAYSLNEMGLIHGDLGEYQKALDSYSEAKTIYSSLGDRRSEAGMLINIAWTYGALGESQKALDLYDQAERIHSAIGYVDPLLLSNIGATYADLGQYQKALDIHMRVLAIRRSVPGSGSQAITLNNIASCYERLGEKLKAVDFYLQALSHMPEIGNAFYTATTLNNIGRLYRDAGEHQKALDYLNQALLLRRTIGDKNGEAATLDQFARVERDRGNVVEALNRIGAALTAVESLRINVKSQQLRASFFASVRRYNEFNIDLLMRLHKQRPAEGLDTTALEASEKGRARSLLELLTEATAEIREGVEPALLERERTLRQTISDKAARQTRLLSGKHTEDQAAAAAREMAALTTEYDQIQGRIRETSPRYAALTQPVPLNLKQIQSEVLDGETLMLEYALGEEKSFLWAVTPASIESFELPKREEIERAARRVYELLGARNQRIANETLEQRRDRLDRADAEYPKASAALSRMLLGPVASELKNKRLFIVSEGVLQYIPFAALPDPQGGDWRALVVDHEIVSAPSASVVAVLRRETANRKPAAKSLAVLADPVFSKDDPRVLVSGKSRAPSVEIPSMSAEAKRSAAESGLGDLKRLRFSREEAHEITGLVGETMKLEAVDFEANRGLATSSELGQYRIVHLATHGLINNEHPELSGVVLSLVDDKGMPQNGFLRLYDLYNLKLSADIVVLSACQTALGKEIKGEGLVGLTRGFMYAGVPRVVASLWQVEDRASAELMKRFYQRMLGQGLRPAAALRAAQVSMQNDNRWRAPHYWAAFTIQGEWK
jgi:CHAT domain-containing protein/Tfp pilus assembly protein PilF